MLLHRGQGGGLNAGKSLDLPLTTSVVPVSSAGSSTATFTRATTATVFDWESILKTPISGEVRFQGARRVRNLLQFSEAFTNGVWLQASANLATITANVSDPLGGTSAFTLSGTGAASGIYQGPVSTSTALLNSIWIRRRTGTGIVKLSKTDNTRIDITASVTASWQRFSLGVAGNSASQAFLVVTLDTNGDQVDIWRGQIEDVTGQSNQNPSEYVSVGVLSSPFQGAMVDGVQYFATQNGNTVASNVVTAGTGAAIASTTLLGYLSEEARTNNCLWNRDFTNAAWVATTMTVAKDQVGIDGAANSASSLLATGANSTVKQTVTIAAVNRPFSVYIKRLVGTGGIAIAQDGATFTDVTASVPSDSAYHRVTLVASQLNPILSIRLATSADKIAVDYAALEDTGGAACTGALSPIATTTVAVTRNVDLLSYPSSGNIDYGAAHTIYCEASYSAIDGVGSRWNVAMGSDVNYDGMIRCTTGAANAASSYFSDSGGTVSATLAGTDAARQNIVTKYVGRRGTGNLLDIFVAGTKGTTSAAAGVAGAQTKIIIGNQGAPGGFALNGPQRNVKLWTVALADSQIASL